MDIIIKDFSAEYVNPVAEIEKICFAHPWSEKSLAEELENDKSHFFVACAGTDEATVSGYIGMQAIVDGAYITNVAVLPQYRRHGIGDMLLKKAIACAKALNLDFITLEVRPSNTAAVSLYERNGFITVGRRKSFYRSPVEDGLIMTLQFNENE